MIIDSHIHYALMASPEKVLEALDLTHCDYGCLVAQIDKSRVNETLDVLTCKHFSNGRLYAYGALNPILYFHQDRMSEMVEHVKNIMACGCDGIKMIEGKPTDRKKFPIPNFDDPCFDPYFSYVEKEHINIVWHVNDPEEFWDDKLVPDWARRSGWFYGDGSYVNNIDQYNQIENVLKRHPNLSITFAHFYFLSADLNKLGELFDKYPNVCVDITPGVELFENISKNYLEGRNFFIKYQDRILYGTDISLYKCDSGELNVQDTLDRGNLCHDFLSKDKVFIKGDPNSLLGKDDLNLHGLFLPKDVVEKIESGNFLRRNGSPKPLNKEAIKKEISRQRERIVEFGNIYGYEPNSKVLDYMEEVFK